VLYDCGLVSTIEPFQQLFNQGMILAYSYQDANGKYYYPDEVEEQNGAWYTKRGHIPVQTQIEKMSKSKLNVVDPDDVIAQYGADAMRLYELFIGPLSASAPWQMTGVDGIYRFLQRVWRLVVDENTGGLNAKLADIPGDRVPELWKQLHKTIKEVVEDTSTIDKMNTAISHMMVFVNAATQAETLPRETVTAFLRVLSPYAPHITEELWERLGEIGLLAHATWPVHDEALCVDETNTIVVQVNGRVRASLEVPLNMAKDELETMAVADERVRKHIGGKNVARVIVVPGRLVNVVVK
jgi:leucyl-tRNA synthetase